MPAEVPRAMPPAGARNVVLVVLDSLRYDTWMAAPPPSLRALGGVQRRFSYATWTAPSHYNLLMGLLPHPNPRQIHASEYYRRDFRRWGERLGVGELEYARLLPSLFLPTLLRSLGYETHARVSMPVLNAFTPLNHDFDSYELMDRHDDLGARVAGLHFSAQRPSFWLLNTGETHYPYSWAGPGGVSELPHLPGVHGVVRDLAGLRASSEEAADLFGPAVMNELRARQVAALEHLDGVFESLLARLPAGTWLIVTSDHGELFGEDGFFGHGPIMHEKVLEVPFLEGLVG